MLDFDLLKDCYGCGACVNVLPARRGAYDAGSGWRLHPRN